MVICELGFSTTQTASPLTLECDKSYDCVFFKLNIAVLAYFDIVSYPEEVVHDESHDPLFSLLPKRIIIMIKE